MIKTLTLNPAVDKAVTVENFAVGTVNRITSVRLDAGGKGLNVARVLHRLGAPTMAVAPVGGGAGRFLADRMLTEGIPHDFLEIEGESRTNLKVFDPARATHTDINESGLPLKQNDLSRIEKKLLSDLKPGDWVVFSGSAPAGVPATIYGDWISRARRLGVRTVLDAEGELFARGLEGKPDLVKPNRSELETWFGRPIGDEADLLDAVARLRAAGAETVAVSLGGEGAWLVTESGCWFAQGLKVKALSTVGAGDALVAGLTWSLAQGLDAEKTLAHAVAVATASVVKPGTGAGDPRDIENFLARVAVRYQPFSGRNP